MGTKKSCLVTGSTQGIGKAIADTFVKEGFRVIRNSRSANTGYDLFFQGDVTNSASCMNLTEYVTKSVGKLDVLVLNVGSGRSVSPGNENQGEWLRVLQANLLSATTPIEALKDKIIHDRTSIVFISSICGLEALGAPLTYSCSKAALNSYTRGLAKAWGKYGVRVNAVAAGNILFPGSVWEKKLADNNSLVEEMLNREVALNRLGIPEEIANAVFFLASEKASFITGSILVADGGQVKG